MKKETVYTNIARLSLAVLCVTSFTGCDKRVHVDGRVLSRHGIPTQNVRVTVTLGHGEHAGGGGYIEMTTNSNGEFNYNGKICNSCWTIKINATSADSGYAEAQMGSKGGSGIGLQLK